MRAINEIQDNIDKTNEELSIAKELERINADTGMGEDQEVRVCNSRPVVSHSNVKRETATEH